MNCLSNRISFAFAFIITSILGIFASQECLAADNQKFVEFIATYLSSAFEDQNGAITKPVLPHGVTYSVRCVADPSDKCWNNTNYVEDSVIENDRVNFAKSETPWLTFYFGSTPDTQKAFNENAGDGPVKSFTDSSDPDCLLRSHVKDNVITDAEIYVSLDQATKKIVMCISVQFYQALGLSLPNSTNFKSTWDTPLFGLRDLGKEQVNAIRQGYAIFEYVHMCGDILPGERIDQVRSALFESSPCLSGLKGF